MDVLSESLNKSCQHAFYTRGYEGLAQQFFERRVSDLIIRLQAEPSAKLSPARYRELVSHSHFTKSEGKALLRILEERGVVRNNCICIHVIQKNRGMTT
jgi:hypothetical protein